MKFHVCFRQYAQSVVFTPILSAFLLGLWCIPGMALAADSVSTLGRLEPAQGVIRVSAPLTPESNSGSIVAKLLVTSGQDVEQGQLLAEMETLELSTAHLAEAEAALELAVRHEAAQSAAATEVCVRAQVAARESERRVALLERGVAGEEEADLAAGRAEALAAACTSAKTAAYASGAEIGLAQARVDRREVELQRSLIRAPTAGRILAIHTWPGEMAALEGLLEIGQVNKMYAVAEVYETDIGRVRIGQKATISSSALDSVLTGTVEKIHQKVAKLDVIGTDPAARKDARIIEVEIRLDDSTAAASLTYLQVDIVINP